MTLDDICPPFHSPRYPTDGESNSDTRLKRTYLVETNPSESSYLTYCVGSYHSKPSQPSVICLSSDSSALSTGPAPSLASGCGRARGGGRGDDAPDGFESGNLHSMVDLEGTYWADHENNPFVGSYRVIIFFMARMGSGDVGCIPFLMYLSFLLYLVRSFCKVDSRYQTRDLLCVTCCFITNYV